MTNLPILLFFAVLVFVDCRQDEKDKKNEINYGDLLYANAAYQATEGAKYAVKTSATATSAVQIYDLTKPGMKAMLRVDWPHGKTSFNHINLNPKMAGLKADPHIYLPPGSTYVSEKVVSSLQTVNTVATGAALLSAAYEIYDGVQKDAGREDNYHTTHAVARLGGTWAGASYGGSWGAYAGSFVLPGVGTVVGGFVGGVFGSLYASSWASSLTDTVIYKN